MANMSNLKKVAVSPAQLATRHGSEADLAIRREYRIPGDATLLSHIPDDEGDGGFLVYSHSDWPAVPTGADIPTLEG